MPTVRHSEPSEKDRRREFIKGMLGRPIVIQRCFVDLTGDFSSAVMLSQAYYWSERTNDPEGWFWKTADEWEDEICLTLSEQQRARTRLKQFRFWIEENRGMPRRTFYRIDLDALLLALEGRYAPPTVEECIALHSSVLNQLSKTGLMRARKLGLKDAQYVSYREILERDGLVCHVCGEAITKGPGHRNDALAFDHVIPLSKGGTHTPENIKPTHAICNNRKADSNPSTVEKQQSVYRRKTSPSRLKEQRPPTVDGQESISLMGIYIEHEITSEITPKTTTEREEAPPAPTPLAAAGDQKPTQKTDSPLDENAQALQVAIAEVCGITPESPVKDRDKLDRATRHVVTLRISVEDVYAFREFWRKGQAKRSSPLALSIDYFLSDIGPWSQTVRPAHSKDPRLKDFGPQSQGASRLAALGIRDCLNP